MTAAIDVRVRLSPQFEVTAAFEAPAGFTILFGASGSGKTTLLRTIAGLQRPDAGRIAVGDRVLFDEAGGVNVPVPERRIGYVFQQLALFPHMSVAANIEYGLQALPASERRARTRAIADAFEIEALLDRRPSRLSGGERQRVALARTLVAEPSLLLLDEPLSALDRGIQSWIVDDLRRWNESQRIPVVYVTHNHREVYALGERVVVMDAGRVLATGSPHDVLDRPEHGQLATLAGFENVFDALVSQRHDASGTMLCRIGDVDLEVPATAARPGDRVRVAIRAGDIMLANHEPRGLSARNILPGRLTEVRSAGATAVASLNVGMSLTVHLTPGGLSSLGVSPGSAVWAIVKTYSCRVLAGTGIR